MVFEGADATGFEADARLTAMWLWTLNAPDSSKQIKAKTTKRTPTTTRARSQRSQDSNSNMTPRARSHRPRRPSGKPDSFG